jgi:hypothetical protein
MKAPGFSPAAQQPTSNADARKNVVATPSKNLQLTRTHKATIFVRG